MLSVLLALSLAQPAVINVAVPSLNASGLDAERVGAYVDRFSTQLASPQVKVVTSRDVSAVLSVERQRQLLGCTESSQSCLVELAGALGADIIVSGSLARLDSGFLVTLRAVQASSGKVLSTLTHRAASEGALIDWLDTAAVQMRSELLRASGLSSAPSVSSAIVRWVPALLGVVAAGVGVGFLVVARNHEASLLAEPPNNLKNVAAIEERVSSGKTFEGVGWGLVAAGAVGITVSVVWALLSLGEPPVHVAANGRGVSFEVHF